MSQFCGAYQQTAVASPQAYSDRLPADDVECPPVGQAMAALHSKMALPRVSEATAACKNLTTVLLEASSLPDSGVRRRGPSLPVSELRDVTLLTYSALGF